MCEQNYGEILCHKIIELRKKAGLTQEQLADKVGITFQAVSKWENSQSCPDIVLLPKLAEIFNVTIDELFGKESSINVNTNKYEKEIPWQNDGKLRAVLYIGHELVMKSDEMTKKFIFEYEGEALNVESHFAINCGDIKGNAVAGNTINCGDIKGNATAGDNVNCSDVGGNANGGNTVNCADVGGNVSVGHDLNCADISGDVLSCSGKITCVDIHGDVKYSGSIECNEINGRVNKL